MVQTGSLSPNTIEMKFIAAGQSWIGIVHRVEARIIARYTTLRTESSVENKPRFLVTCRSCAFREAMHLRYNQVSLRTASRKINLELDARSELVRVKSAL